MGMAGVDSCAIIDPPGSRRYVRPGQRWAAVGNPTVHWGVAKW